MRTVSVVTVGRSDFAIYLPLLKAIKQDPELSLHLSVVGMHWLPEFGMTVDEIKKEGFSIGEKIELPLDDDSPDGLDQAIGSAVAKFSTCYSKNRPDILLVLGDRFEMHAAVLAALPHKIPVAHIHGGELTQGAIDDALRHSITKLSHLHFVATEEYGKRVRQLGEEAWRVTVSGAPALDGLKDKRLYSREELSQVFDIPLQESPLLVTYHPVTLEYEQTEQQMKQLLSALSDVPKTIIFTGSNTDTKNHIIREMVQDFVKSKNNAYYVASFGPEYYFSMLSISCAMVGNSSSGLIEAPSFELPVVNIGTRQQGRVRAQNIIDVGYSSDDIANGISKAISEDFRNSLIGMENPHVHGAAATIIVDRLKTVTLDDAMLLKRFNDL